jgi:hypothetical protein
VISPPVVVGLPYAPYVVTADVLRHWLQEFCDGVRRVRGYPRRPSAQYLTADFFHPDRALRRFLDNQETWLRGLVEIAGRDGLRDADLETALNDARSTLAALPALRAEFLPFR